MVTITEREIDAIQGPRISKFYKVTEKGKAYCEKLKSRIELWDDIESVWRAKKEFRDRYYSTRFARPIDALHVDNVCA